MNLFEEDLERIAALVRSVQAVSDECKCGFSDVTVYLEDIEVVIGIDDSGSSYVAKSIK